MDYQVECPFCGTEQQLTGSEFPVTETECKSCGARYNCDNSEEKVTTITGIPRTEYEVSVEGSTTIPVEEVGDGEEAVDQFLDSVRENPEEVLGVAVRDGVSEDRVREVLEAGINGDGVSVSKNIPKSVVRRYGVDV